MGLKNNREILFDVVQEGSEKKTGMHMGYSPKRLTFKKDNGD